MNYDQICVLQWINADEVISNGDMNEKENICCRAEISEKGI